MFAQKQNIHANAPAGARLARALAFARVVDARANSLSQTRARARRAPTFHA
ncbi:collagenase-like PrtC family protease [Ereboglobus sp. PH5-5]|nr:collagenase-like PrtC family protease [Ereboglobus sp. PH5-5]